MGLRINQNIAALNAARNLRITDGAMSKSLERLSSGFRINRAADDPAGLIISENLRAQVAGLGQAIKNSNNAVNLIKTAEAALDEVLKQVRSIRTLALDALNTGASDAVARAADQTQIQSSIDSINRIANTTQFGKIKLLNGSSGVRGSTNDVTLQFVKGTTKTVAGTYTVDVATAATKGSQTFTVKHAYATADGTPPAALALASGHVLACKVVFGVGAGLS
ncbi:MAG: flagellin, partial [Chloroflexota bacterium]